MSRNNEQAGKSGGGRSGQYSAPEPHDSFFPENRAGVLVEMRSIRLWLLERWPDMEMVAFSDHDIMLRHGKYLVSLEIKLEDQ